MVEGQPLAGRTTTPITCRWTRRGGYQGPPQGQAEHRKEPKQPERPVLGDQAQGPTVRIGHGFESAGGL